MKFNLNLLTYKSTLLVGLFITLLTIGCKDTVGSKKTITITDPVINESKPQSIVEQSFYIPMSQRAGSGGDEFVCILPNGKFVRVYIDYNGGNWIYYQNNESEYRGTYKVLNSNTLEVTEVFKGEYGGEYNWRFQFSIIDTYFGGRAFELRAINSNGQLTQDGALWFTSADIDVATKLNFK